TLPAQAVAAPPSSAHQVVAAGSSVLKLALAVWLAEPAGGLLVKLTVGPVLSMVKPADELAPVLPAWSVAYSVTVCGPSGRPLRSTGLVQAVAVPPSTEHQTVALGSLTV